MLTTIGRQLALLTLAVATCAMGGQARAQGDAQPLASLESHGLKKMGRHWCVPEELALRELLAALPGLEKRQLELRLLVEQAAEQNEASRASLAALETAHQRSRDLAKAAAAGTAQRKQLDVEVKSQTAAIDALKKGFAPTEKLAAAPPLKTAIIELVNVRNELALALLSVDRNVEQMHAHYEKLKNVESVQEALAATSAGEAANNASVREQLGPAKNYTNELARAEKIRQVALSGPLPIFREGKHWRVTAILGEQLPATFTFDNQSGPIVLSATLAESAGIVHAPGAAAENYRAEGGRTVAARPAIIPRLRLGAVVLDKVPCLVLPPEAEDFGSRLGHDGLEKARLKLDAAKLLLRVEAAK